MPLLGNRSGGGGGGLSWRLLLNREKIDLFHRKCECSVCVHACSCSRSRLLYWNVHVLHLEQLLDYHVSESKCSVHHVSVQCSLLLPLSDLYAHPHLFPTSCFPFWLPSPQLSLCSPLTPPSSPSFRPHHLSPPIAPHIASLVPRHLPLFASATLLSLLSLIPLSIFLACPPPPQCANTHLVVSGGVLS